MVPDRSSATMRPSGKAATARRASSVPDDEPASVVEKISVPFRSNARMAPPPPGAETAATIVPGAPAATACGIPATGIVPRYEPFALYIWMRPMPSDTSTRPSAWATAMPVGSTNVAAAAKLARLIRCDRIPFGSNMRTERPSVLRSSRIRARIEPSGAAATARGASRCESPPTAASNPPAYS